MTPFLHVDGVCLATKLANASEIFYMGEISYVCCLLCTYKKGILKRKLLKLMFLRLNHCGNWKVVVFADVRNDHCDHRPFQPEGKGS